MLLDELLLHPKTHAAIHQSIQGGSHAVALAGPAGSGKLTLARAIAAQVLGTTPGRLTVAPYYTQLEPINNTLTIDQVRDLQRFLRLKTTGTASVRRVAVLAQADAMNTQAQNALLKTLEEPPLDTMLLLTVADAELLLPTVRSRLQLVHVLPPTLAAVQDYLQGQATPAVIDRAYAISGGGMGLLTSLLDGDGQATAAEAIDQAKQILGMPHYQRLLQVDALAKDKAQVAALISGLKRVCRGALLQSAQRSNTTHARAWHKRLQIVAQAQQLQTRGANTKLLLTDLFLQL